MPRAAAIFTCDENTPVNDASTVPAEQVYTTLRSTSASASAGERRAEIPPVRQGWTDASDVATSFITNISGGAACFDVDLALIANDALTKEVSDAFNEARALMLLANDASWSVDNAAESTAVVVATATMRGKDSYTETQRFTLHLDLAAAERPISSVVAHERVHTNTETWSRSFEEALLGDAAPSRPITMMCTHSSQS